MKKFADFEEIWWVCTVFITESLETDHKKKIVMNNVFLAVNDRYVIRIYRFNEIWWDDTVFITESHKTDDKDKTDRLRISLYRL